MSKFFKAKTRSGQTFIYCIADGARGRQALLELKRDCENGEIVELSAEELRGKVDVNDAGKSTRLDSVANDFGPEPVRHRSTGR